jgi:hypothetical protein
MAVGACDFALSCVQHQLTLYTQQVHNGLIVTMCTLVSWYPVRGTLPFRAKSARVLAPIS